MSNLFSFSKTSTPGALLLLLAAGPVYAGTVTVSTRADTGSSSDGLCSVREAAAKLAGGSADSSCVEVGASTDIIQLDGGAYCLTSALAVESSLTVRGDSDGTSTLDAGNGSSGNCGTGSGDRVLSVNANLSVTLENLTVEGGHSTQGGGGVLAGSGVALTLTDVTVRDNEVLGTSGATLGGGGVYVGSSGSLSVTDSIVSDNLVDCPDATIGKCARGGGIHTESGTDVTITDSVISDNVVVAAYDASRGGGVFLGSTTTAPSSLTVSGTTISGNSAEGDGPSGALGGGVGTEYCSVVTIDDSVVEDNSVTASAARAFGAGLAINFCDSVTVNRTTVRGNSNYVSAAGVGAYGGGVYLSSVTTTTLTSSTFSDNEVVHAGTSAEAAYGGGLYVYDGTARLLNMTLSGNRADANGKAYGGGLFVKGTVSAYLAHSTVALNEADGGSGAYGGGVSHFPSGSSTTRPERIILLNTVLSGNDAGGVSPKGDDCYETTYTLGRNVLSNDDSCYLNSSLATGTVTDQVDVDAVLSALASNGGLVQTHALGSTSPARGTASCLDATGAAVTVDARGTARDTRCDAGAYEYGDRRRRVSATESGAGMVLDFDGEDPESESYTTLGWGCAVAPGQTAGTLALIGLAAAAARRRTTRA